MFLPDLLLSSLTPSPPHPLPHSKNIRDHTVYLNTPYHTREEKFLQQISRNILNRRKKQKKLGKSSPIFSGSSDKTCEKQPRHIQALAQ